MPKQLPTTMALLSLTLLAGPTALAQDDGEEVMILTVEGESATESELIRHSSALLAIAEVCEDASMIVLKGPWAVDDVYYWAASSSADGAEDACLALIEQTDGEYAVRAHEMVENGRSDRYEEFYPVAVSDEAFQVPNAPPVVFVTRDIMSMAGQTTEMLDAYRADRDSLELVRSFILETMPGVDSEELGMPDAGCAAGDPGWTQDAEHLVVSVCSEAGELDEQRYTFDGEEFVEVEVVPEPADELEGSE